jgi:hypothetical protein
MLFTLKDRHSPFIGGVFLFVMTGVFLLTHTGVFLFGLAGGNQFIIYIGQSFSGMDSRNARASNKTSKAEKTSIACQPAVLLLTEKPNEFCFYLLQI